MNMDRLRKEIDTIDEKVLELLNRRAEKAIAIGRLKSQGKGDFYAPHREKKIMEQLVRKNKGPVSNESMTGIFREIFNVSRAMQKTLTIVYFGPEATFTHLAAIKNFGADADFVPEKNIKDVFLEVEKERADYGVVPVENSTEGVVNYTLDMFMDSRLKICAEIMLEVSLNLLAKGKGISGIKRIYSHSHVFGQCRKWIDNNLPHAECIQVASTSEAAKRVSKDKGSAAIASSLASRLYGLNIVAEKIEDIVDNYTRFLVIGRKPVPRSGNDKTSIMFSVKDRVGALHDMLVPFKKNRINLTKIESRPSKRKAWEYIFFVDFEGHIEDSRVKKALAELEKHCVILKILGSYPRHE